MTRLLLKPLLGVLMLFAIVSLLGLTLWIIKDLWYIILICMAGVYLMARVSDKK